MVAEIAWKGGRFIVWNEEPCKSCLDFVSALSFVESGVKALLMLQRHVVDFNIDCMESDLHISSSGPTLSFAPAFLACRMLSRILSLLPSKSSDHLELVSK